MNNAESGPPAPVRPEVVPSPTEDLDLIELLKRRLERLENVQEIDQLTQLILRLRREQQEMAVTRVKTLEEIRRTRFETRVSFVRQVSNLALAIGRSVAGPVVYLWKDQITGAFLTSVGFTSLGLSSDLVRSFFERYQKR